MVSILLKSDFRIPYSAVQNLPKPKREPQNVEYGFTNVELRFF